MERFNGEVRDREIYHNYIREHQGISKMTPAEKCGIKVEGDNKWATLIQNAKKNI